jgi:hypothetical protein
MVPDRGRRRRAGLAADALIVTARQPLWLGMAGLRVRGLVDDSSSVEGGHCRRD